MRTIVIVNRSTVVSDAIASAFALGALQTQVSRDFAPIWEQDAKLGFASTPPASAEQIVILDTSDQAGALGYHETTPAGLPVGFVFAKTTLQAGEHWQATLSHELLEQILDPWCDWAVQGAWKGKPAIFAGENCLAGETEVQLTDGSARPIAELAEEGGAFSVWAVDKTGQVVEAEALAVRRTGENQPAVRVKTADGKAVRCTPDHRFLLANGQYREARHLRRGDLLRALPALAVAHSVNRGQTNAEPGGQRLDGFVAGSDFNDVGEGEFGVADLFAKQVAIADHAALGNSVGDVVPVRAKEEMVGVDAGRRVALMANEKAGRDAPFVMLERKPMGEMDFAIAPELPISRAAFSSGPQPTTSPLLNARPKAIHQACSPHVVSGNSGRKIAVAMLPAPMGGAKSASANRTNAALDSACSDRRRTNAKIGIAVTSPPLPMEAAQTACTHKPSTSIDRACCHAISVDSVECDGKADVYDLTVPIHHNFAVASGVFVHNCDPVENDEYKIGADPVSNFVTPAWFGMPKQFPTGTKTDFMGTLGGRAFALSKGGYVSYCTQIGRWQQAFADKTPVHQQTIDPLSRRGRRAARAKKAA